MLCGLKECFQNGYIKEAGVSSYFECVCDFKKVVSCCNISGRYKADYCAVYRVDFQIAEYGFSLKRWLVENFEA